MLSTLLLLFTVFCSLLEATWCPDGAFAFSGEQKCAMPYTNRSTFAMAEQYCEKQGGTVATIGNVFENTYLSALIGPDFNKEAPYIGVVRSASGTWTTPDGQPLPNGYTSWNSGEPRTGYNCTVLDPRTSKWNSSLCTVSRPSFCSMAGIVGGCPSGWAYHNAADSCYYLQSFIYTSGQTWAMINQSDAEAKCQSMNKNAHLVSIHSDAENTFVNALISSNVGNFSFGSNPCNDQWVWLGYYGRLQANAGRWFDGSLYDYVGFYSSSSTSYALLLSNDPSCSRNKYWSTTYPSNLYARYVCKMPARDLVIGRNN